VKKPFLFLVVSAFLGLSLPCGAAIEKDLEQGLFYYRVTDAKADQAGALSAIERHPALVLDLRSLAADPAFAASLRDALAKKPAAHSAKLVLINPTTDASLVQSLDADFIDVVTIGPASKAIKLDIAVHISEADDRKAFEALANGTALEKLIADNLDKRRYDEAKLVHDHANGVSPTEEPGPADADDDSVKTEPATTKKAADETKNAEPPLVDLVLERAIQVHRSLLALKRL
jgi:hypothetical protein